MNAYDYLYYCKTCGYWEKATSMDLEEDWTLLKAYKHDCPKCKEPMAWTDDAGDIFFDEIKCNKCGQVMEDDGMFMWD